MRRGAGRLLVASATLALVAAAPVGTGARAAEGEGAAETGVWWQGNQGHLALPPPPVLVDLPDGGLWLSSGPNGDVALSAVRFDIPDHAVPEELVLRIHQDSSTPGPALALCPPADEWRPPAQRPGAWSERAVPDCDRFSAVGVVDGETIRFPLANLVDGAVDLVLTRVPTDSESYVNVTFKAPSAGDLRTRSSVSSGDFVAPPTTSAGPFVDDAGLVGPGFVLDTPFDAAIGAEVSGDGLGPVEPITEAAAPSEQHASPVMVGEAWDTARWVALVVLMLIGGWMAMIARDRFRSGVPAATFTIYRGTPPR